MNLLIQNVNDDVLKVRFGRHIHMTRERQFMVEKMICSRDGATSLAITVHVAYYITSCIWCNDPRVVYFCPAHIVLKHQHQH